MNKPLENFTKASSFKIVLTYTIVSAIYIYSSDYFLETTNLPVDVISKLQTYKGLGFITITALMLYVLIERNKQTILNYYHQILGMQKASEENISNSRKQYMALFNHSPLPMWIFDIETYKFLLVNESACQTYGYTADEFLNMSIKDIRPIEDIPMLMEFMQISIQHDMYDLPKSIRHKKKNGDIFHVKVKTSSIEFAGKIARLVSAMDVTAEINLQHELLYTNSKLLHASEIAGMGHWSYDLEKAQIHWSDQLYRIFEIDPTHFEMTFDNIKNCFHPDDRKNFEADIYKDLTDGLIIESEHRIITSSGKLKWLLERQYLTSDENLKPISREGIAIDITNRKLFEQELLASNERFKILANATVEAIIDWDTKQDKILWGEGFHNMFGYDLSTPDKRLWSKNLHPEDRERVLHELNTALHDPSQLTCNTEYRFLKADGSIAFVQHKEVFIRDEEGIAVRALAAMIDHTDALERIHRIENQNTRLKEIAWTQSHLVRAPLANLIGFIQLLKEDRSNLNDQELIDHISDSTDKLDAIIHDIVKKTIEVDGMKLDQFFHD